MAEAFEHSQVETNGIRLHVVSAGDPGGKPVLLLHGFPEFWYSWRLQIPALAEAGFHVIAPDQRGYNLSDKPDGIGSYRIQELVNDSLGLMDHFGLHKAAVIGHDWGAAVAWQIALSQPERVERLGILNVPHPAVMMDFLHHSLRQMLRSWYAGFFQIPVLPEWLLALDNYAAAARLLRSSGKAGTFTADDIHEYKKAWSQPGGMRAMVNWYRAAFRERSSLSIKQKVTVPTLILWGKRDVALRTEMAQRSLEMCEEGRLIYFENATHWVQLDEAEAVNAELVNFLGAGFPDLTGSPSA